eukprot:CAMPEP_0174908056 /NCGR_PEP_ID=MMETSP0167-20121228/63242_1 /TAXON_ID=38298 /ORGANISM="Rhodella maculata, Strain CCMP736" /LENGTH=55 /DNA_ID=CAMNT_0016151697 /DNA_START=1 /DNA_END=165 /DNA_ORIENTATION=-
MFGEKDMKAIADHVGSRTITQVRTHAQKYFLRVAKQKGGGTPSGANGGDGGGGGG